jgi:magnesium transporter
MTLPAEPASPTARDEEDPEATLRLRFPARLDPVAGARPGLGPEDLALLPTRPGAAAVTCVDFSASQLESRDVRDLAAFLADHRPAWSAVRWVDVGGLSDLGVVEALARKYHLHPLAVEDVLHVPQRPKCEAYPAQGDTQARLFVVARVLGLADGRLREEQVSLFVGHNTVLTFRERGGDELWATVRHRLSVAGSHVRQHDASYLVYSLLDSIVDRWFPLLEELGDRLEKLEDEVLESPSREAISQVHALRRELLVLRRVAWPMREVIAALQREPHECLSDTTRTYLRDVHDHIVQVIEMIEAYREVVGSVQETFMTATSNRMNEVMKVLTVVGTIFIPITFLAGVYGMNFHHMPELDSGWSYPAFWVLCASVSGGMLLWMKRRGWI